MFTECSCKIQEKATFSPSQNSSPWNLNQKLCISNPIRPLIWRDRTNFIRIARRVASLQQGEVDNYWDYFVFSRFSGMRTANAVPQVPHISHNDWCGVRQGCAFSILFNICHSKVIQKLSNFLARNEISSLNAFLLYCSSKSTDHCAQ